MTAIVDLKAVRNMLGMSSRQLAERLGVSPYELAFMERRGCLSDRMAEKLANIMKTTHLDFSADQSWTTPDNPSHAAGDDN